MHAALRRFGSPEAVFYADAEAYRGIEGLKNAEPLEDKDLTEPRRILSECHRKSIHILTWQDAAYPARLRSIFLSTVIATGILGVFLPLVSCTSISSKSL